ncbi:MAG: putative porin [Gammaproteobacteria bacterium]|jgi:hypothetical protein|nr:putative porin [Gammaproteobacteria bacterium]
MSKFYLFLTSISLFLSSAVLGEVAHSPSSSSLLLLSPPEDPSFFNFSGYLDGSYNYLSRSNRFTSGFYDRINDLAPNGFTLQQAAVTMAKQPTQGSGVLLNLILGRDANNLAPFGMNPNMGIQNVGFTVTQAYLQYAVPAFTVMGGLFDSLAGAENYNPTTDTNFSRSILDGYAEPSTFLGLRGTYAPNSSLSLFVGVNNGWDTIEDTARRVTFELGAIYTMNSQCSFEIQGFNGQQRTMDEALVGPTGIRNALDFVAIYHATEKLTYMANYDYGIQNRADLANGKSGKAIWQGIAGYINYQFNERWQSSLRAEIFSDYQGFRTGVQQTWKEATVTVGYSPLKHLTLRAETRRDFSNVPSFVDKNGQGVGNNLQSFALEALYVFS